MKVLALSSSPRPQSNSTFLLNTVLDEVRRSGKHSVEQIDVAKLQIAPCRACESCHTDGVCIIRDDMDKVMPAILNADVILMSTPLYWWSISAQLKLVIDRMFPIPPGAMKDKKLVLIMTGGSGTGNIAYKSTFDTFAAICEFNQMKFLPFFVSAPDDRPARDNAVAIGQAKSIGGEL
jgi:multimeric flavodoxin WrbA